MNLFRAVAFVLLAVFGFAPLDQASAQAYPTRPVTLIVPFGAGGPTDIIFRILADGMKEGLGQPLIIENRPGAGGGLGSQQIREAKPDGYTLGGTGGGPVAVPHYTKAFASLDFIRDFSSISYVCYGPLVVMVHPSLPVHDWKDLIAYAKANPGKLNWGMQNVAVQADAALLKRKTGAEFQLIPYKGGGPMLAALAAGEIHVGRDVPGSAKPFLDGGKVRPIGIMSDKAWPAHPNLSTIADATGVTPAIPAWFGLHGPANMPKAVVDRIATVTRAALNRPDIKKKLEDLSFYVDGGGPAVLEARIRADNEIHRAAIASGDVKPE
jgi:tripartite-type tricarboxylate transporter receptor subunit TctC